MTEIVKPDAGAIADKGRLLEVLVRYYDALVELDGNILPSQAPALKAITCASLAALRKVRGATDGELGPRLVLLVGTSTPIDGGQAIYAWSASSLAVDDNASVIRPAAVASTMGGRWLRFSSLAGFTDAGITQLTGDVTAGPGNGSQVATVAATLKTGRLLRAPQVLTSGTSISHPAGTTSIYVVGVAGGGAGGGANAAAGAVGAQGGSGTYGERTFTSPALTSTYAIGAAGAGASGTVGGTGGNTTFTNGATTLTLPGGVGGGVLTGGATVGTAAGGAGGGAATNADISISGQQGASGVRPVAATTPCFHVGPGGSNPYGQGGSARAAATTQVAGGSPTGFGAGGGGVLNGTTTTAAAGANGGSGLLIVWEYS